MVGISLKGIRDDKQVGNNRLKKKTFPPEKHVAIFFCREIHGIVNIHVRCFPAAADTPVDENTADLTRNRPRWKFKRRLPVFPLRCAVSNLKIFPCFSKHNDDRAYATSQLNLPENL